MPDVPAPRSRLALVGDGAAPAGPAGAAGPAAPAGSAAPPPVPAETAPAPEEAPDLLAALDAGDEEAVKVWLRAHTPEASSLVIYGLLLGAGVVGLVEWPALVITALAQVVVDRRLGGVEHVVAELRRRTATPTGT